MSTCDYGRTSSTILLTTFSVWSLWWSPGMKTCQSNYLPGVLRVHWFQVGLYDDTWPLRTVRCVPHWKTHKYTFLQWRSSPRRCFKKSWQDQNQSLLEVDRPDPIVTTWWFSCTLLESLVTGGICAVPISSRYLFRSPQGICWVDLSKTSVMRSSFITPTPSTFHPS